MAIAVTSRGPQIRPLRPAEREAALGRLAGRCRLNLLLIDAIRRLGSGPLPGEARAEVLSAWSGGALVGLAAVQPTIAIEEPVDELGDAFRDALSLAPAGLLKAPEAQAGRLWERLRRRGRQALLDRFESGYCLERGQLAEASLPPGATLRPAAPGDLAAVVAAARASLRAENRPDPFDGDPQGFQRWVAGRIARATVIERHGEPRFVGYADVQCREGWLLQGVFTHPGSRRQGLAAAGVAALCRDAFAAGADHVQLAVVEGNEAAERLYEGLGFRRFARLRTILFS